MHPNHNTQAEAGVKPLRKVKLGSQFRTLVTKRTGTVLQHCFVTVPIKCPWCGSLSADRQCKRCTNSLEPVTQVEWETGESQRIRGDLPVEEL